MPHRSVTAAFIVTLVLQVFLPADPATADPGIDPLHLGPGAPLAIVAAPLNPGDEVSAEACTLTTIGYDNEQRLVGITAGHCARIGRVVYSETTVRLGPIGRIVKVEHDMSHPPTADAEHPWDEDLDFAVIEFDPRKIIPSSTVASEDTDITITAVDGQPREGQKVCKEGRTSGLTCGVVTDVQEWEHAASFCTKEGDSGAPVIAGHHIIGMVTTSITTVGSDACGTETGSNINAVLNSIGPGIGEGFEPYLPS